MRATDSALDFFRNLTTIAGRTTESRKGRTMQVAGIRKRLLWRETSAVLTGALLATTGTAGAGLAPTEVWNVLKDSWTGMGYEVAANVRGSGDLLSIHGLSLEFESGGEAPVRLEYAPITLKAEDDGTVHISPPEDVAWYFTTDGETFGTKFKLEWKDAGFAASGQPEAMVLDVRANEMRVGLHGVQAENRKWQELPGRLDIVVSGLRNRTEFRSGETLQSDFNADLLKINVDTFDGPAGGARMDLAEAFNLELAVRGINGSTSATVLMETVPGDFAGMIRAGYSSGFEWFNDALSLQAELATHDGEFAVALESESSAVNGALSESGMGFDIESGALSISIPSSEEFNEPFDLSLKAGSLGVVFPVIAGENLPFALSLRLEELALPENLLSYFDPGSILPRDPANLEFDVSGNGKLMTDLADPAAFIMEIENGAGFLPQVLSLNKLLVSLAGTQLTGHGQAEFVIDDQEWSFLQQIPQAKAEFVLTGANRLVDRLVAAGLIEKTQATWIRLQLALLTIPNEDGGLSSMIETNNLGHLFVNGQRVF